MSRQKCEDCNLKMPSYGFKAPEGWVKPTKPHDQPEYGGANYGYNRKRWCSACARQV